MAATQHFHYTYVQDAPYTQALDYDTRTDGQPVYMGLAEPGTATSVTKWQIRKYTYDASGYLTNIQWAGGTADFSYEYDERASYSYS